MIDRRDLIRRAAFILGGSLSAGAIAGVLMESAIQNAKSGATAGALRASPCSPSWASSPRRAVVGASPS